jgi:hypothetical protein
MARLEGCRMTAHGTHRAAAGLIVLCIGSATVATGCGSSGASPTSSTSSAASAGSAASGSSSGIPNRKPTLTKGQAEQIAQTFNGQLKTANIAFATPTKLRVGDTGIVDLQLSMQLPIASLRGRLGPAGAQVGAQILASNTMEAALTGIGFKIQEITVARQAVGSAVTEWKWEIEPAMAGRLTLHIALTAFVEVNRAPTDYGVRTFDRTLQVQSVPVGWPTRVTHFLSSNWVWIAGLISLITGTIGWFLRSRNDHRRESDREQDGLGGSDQRDSRARRRGLPKSPTRDRVGQNGRAAAGDARARRPHAPRRKN